MINNFLNISNIIDFSDRYLKYLIFLMIFIFLLAIYYTLFNSPADYQQGEYVRIMYLHVPSAWLALAIYSFMAVMSFIYLVWHNPVFDFIAKSSASIGALFCFIALVTGALWGKPTWGTWWVWDARLTSMLILFFFYIGYLIVANLTTEQFNSNVPAVLAILGFINVPIVKFSVNIWNSLHQPASILKIGGPSIHSSMLIPLMLMFISFSLYFFINLLLNLKKRIIEQKIIRRKISQFN